MYINTASVIHIVTLYDSCPCFAVYSIGSTDSDICAGYIYSACYLAFGSGCGFRTSNQVYIGSRYNRDCVHTTELYARGCACNRCTGHHQYIIARFQIYIICGRYVDIAAYHAYLGAVPVFQYDTAIIQLCNHTDMFYLLLLIFILQYTRGSQLFMSFCILNWYIDLLFK